VKVIIGICTLVDYSVAKKRQQRSVAATVPHVGSLLWHSGNRG
jgi:hypothetical protein